MNDLELLSDLRRSGVRLWLEDDTLHYSAPPDTLSPALLERIATHKAAIVAFLRRVTGDRPAPPTLESNESLTSSAPDDRSDRADLGQSDPAGAASSSLDVEAPATPGSVYWRGDVDAVPVGGEWLWVCSLESGAGRMVPEQVWAWLRSQDRFVVGPGGEPTAGPHAIPAPKSLLGLVEAGLLVPESEMLVRFARADRAKTGAAVIRTIGCITRNRPDAAVRAVGSYLDHQHQSGRGALVVLIDSSDRIDARARCRAALRPVIDRCGATVRYAGREEKLAFAERLARACGAPMEVVRFALFGPEGYASTATGANRNALLLETAGECALSFDDDTICRAFAPRGAGPDVKLAAKANAFDHEVSSVWPSISDVGAAGAVEPFEGDLIGLHERFLGREVVDCLDGVPVDLRGATSRLLRTLTHDTATIRVTINGLVGDCGWASPFPYLWLGQPSLQRLLKSEATYRAALQCRDVVKASSSVVITDGMEDFMTTAFGYDHTTLLPPFCPIGRGQDRLFGIMIAQCCRHAWLAQLPVSVAHAPPEARSFWPGQLLESADGMDLSTMLVGLVKSFEPDSAPGDSAAGMADLGRYLVQIGELASHPFARRVHHHIWQDFSRFVQEMEARIDRAGPSRELWVRDVQAHIRRRREYLNTDDGWVPLDLLVGHDMAWAVEASRRLVRDFGTLLQWWPVIVAAAGDLRAEGVSMASPI
jgi:hypothetical protein